MFRSGSRRMLCGSLAICRSSSFMPVSVAHSRAVAGITCINPISPSLPTFHGLK